MTDALFMEHLLKTGESFVVHQGRLYFLAPFEKGKPQFRFAKERFLLVPGPTVAEQTLYYARHLKVERHDVTSTTALLLYDVAPRLLATLGDSAVDLERLSDQSYLNSIYAKKLGVELPVEGSQHAPDKKLELICNDAAAQLPDMMHVRGTWRVLTPGKGSIKVNGQDFKEGWSAEDYLVALYNSVKRRLSERQEPPHSALDEIREKTLQFDSFGIDFYQKKVYLKIDPYVLQNMNGEAFYYVPATTIGVYVPEARQVPVMMWFNGRSPFFYGDGRVCLAEYDSDYFHTMPYPDALVRYLLDAKKIVLTGYKRGVHPVNYIQDVCSGISQEEIKRKGLRVTNDGRYTLSEPRDVNE